MPTAVSSEVVMPDDLDDSDILSRIERDDDIVGSGGMCNGTGAVGEVDYDEDCAPPPELVSGE